MNIQLQSTNTSYSGLFYGAVILFFYRLLLVTAALPATRALPSILWGSAHIWYSQFYERGI